MEDQPIHGLYLRGGEYPKNIGGGEAGIAVKKRAAELAQKHQDFFFVGSRLLNQEKRKRPSTQGDQRCTNELQPAAAVLE